MSEYMFEPETSSGLTLVYGGYMCKAVTEVETLIVLKNECADGGGSVLTNFSNNEGRWETSHAGTTLYIEFPMNGWVLIHKTVNPEIWCGFDYRSRAVTIRWKQRWRLPNADNSLFSCADQRYWRLRWSFTELPVEVFQCGFHPEWRQPVDPASQPCCCTPPPESVAPVGLAPQPTAAPPGNVAPVGPAPRPSAAYPGDIAQVGPAPQPSAAHPGDIAPVGPDHSDDSNNEDGLPAAKKFKMTNKTVSMQEEHDEIRKHWTLQEEIALMRSVAGDDEEQAHVSKSKYISK